MIRMGKKTRTFVTLVILAIFAFAMQPDTMAMPQANTAVAQQQTGVTAQALSANLHLFRCCHGMMVCPGMLACHGVAVQMASVIVPYQSIHSFVPVTMPRLRAGIIISPNNPPPIA